jgi:hypothetical protein
MRAHFWLVPTWLPCFACSGAPAPVAPPAAAPTAASPNEPSLTDREWGVLRSPRQGMKLAVPEARTWFVAADAPTGAAWELRHEPTGTSLSVRRWRAARVPLVEQCQRELRQRAAGLAESDETNLVGERTVRAPQGFSTRITLMSLPGPARRVRGQVIAVGAGVGECIAAIANTECAGEVELAERLRLLDVAVAHLRLTHVEDRVPDVAPLPPPR